MTDDRLKSIRKLVANAVRAMRENRHDEALALSEQVLEQDPNHAAASAVIFTTLFSTGNFERARLMGDKAAELNPESEYILNNQACLQLEAKQPAAAGKLLTSLIDKHGEKPQWLYNLGLAERMAGDLEKSIAVFQRTLDLQPRHDKAAFQLADVYHSLGKVESTTRQANYLRLLRPGIATTHCHYLHQAAVSNMVTATDLDLEFRLWGERFIPKNKNYSVSGIANHDKLRIGFNVGEIPQAWWSLMVVPVVNRLSEHDSVFVYWHNPANHAAHLNTDIQIEETNSLSDAKFARLVRKHEIDILIDVCGMRVGCRQRALGLQVASRQFGWLAHEGHYATPLVTPIEDKLGEKRYCFGIKEDINTGTAASTENTLFGINASAGLSEAVVETWSNILLQLDGWALHLDAEQPEVQKELQERFARHDLNAPRITFNTRLRPQAGSVVLENTDHNDVLRAYAAILNGAAVVALHGKLFPAQQTSALLSQIGVTEWIVVNRVEYQAKAIELAKAKKIEGVPEAQLDQAEFHEIGKFTKRFRELIAS